MATPPAYSHRFLAVWGTGVVQTYTPAAGYVAVVRNIDLVTGTATTGSFSVYINNVCFIAQVPSAQYVINSTWHWETRCVVYSGEVLTMNAGAAGYAHVSGYLLSSP